MTPEQLWQATLGELEVSLSRANFTTWFKNTFIADISQQKIIVAVPNAFTKSWLENKYHKSILKALQHLTDNVVREVSYHIVTHDKQGNVKQELVSSHETLAPYVRTASSHGDVRADVSVDVRYTFDNFIVGKGNELAHAASFSVAEMPGKKYNPLFLYGGVGLGKTHLMRAISHYVRMRNPHANVLYVTSEKFTNDFVQALKEGKTKEFKLIYRSPDVLLIDDIQFITGKEQTQEEFFYTFEALHQADKQIVMTSDRPPKAIGALPDRLLSRFEWGMIADISFPDLETRIAILSSKCSEKGCVMSQEVLEYVASNIQNNIRELEGALNKIIAHHQVFNYPPTIETTKEIIASLALNPARGAVTPRKLIEIVARYYDVPIDGLVGSSRKKELVVPRQVAMYLLREEVDASYPAIGQDMGGRDHTTAMHAYQKITAALHNDDRLKQEVANITQLLHQGA
ncbi:MAG TPA: chromosomal replication initiator protein DnaA [Patescibacteria group bacterium]|nr:chromosomal replication initiator protein DnaA [Patescibacteria group bacterium]